MTAAFRLEIQGAAMLGVLLVLMRSSHFLVKQVQTQ